ncbi:hypothetical protein B0H14DRAFT_3094553 [Mycena olivaceomarginata]|nr:hypothetical protein B0H14DRAFT_3094553 [Mycena olivaceomarginata]
MSLSHFLPLPTGLSAALAIHSNVTPNAFADLFTAVGGRLLPGVPLVSPCFGVGTENETDSFRADIFGAFINTQWETCQATGAQCLLDSSDPTTPKATLASEACEQGSIPGRFTDVRDAQDVAASFTFSEQTGTPLVIKNTGHDYKGRSSAPNSLALWMSYHPAFVPEGCSLAQPAATLGAGVQWAEAYEFADAHNITLVGGSDRTVGVVGGWLQGGGHGVLSNMGLGADRVLQFRVVTPDRKLRVANACQNEDLFFALRGGGGGTFGVVLEATLLASPPVTLQAVIVSWPSTSMNRTRALTAELWTILTENGLKWAAEGWGGFSTSEIAILVNPVLDPEQAAASMVPLVKFGERLQQDGVDGAETVVTTFPSFLAFFNAFTLEHVASVGTNLALTSRLIPKSLLSTPSDRAQLVEALQATNDAGPGMIILLVPPVSYVYQEGSTSVTESWRSSVYHVTVVASWAWNATSAEKRAAYQDASRAIDNLRRITPDAACLNEADVYEPNHEASFWGSHYQELLQIKRKYCWLARFSCYL